MWPAGSALGELRAATFKGAVCVDTLLAPKYLDLHVTESCVHGVPTSMDSQLGTLCRVLRAGRSREQARPMRERFSAAKCLGSDSL